MCATWCMNAQDTNISNYYVHPNISNMVLNANLEIAMAVRDKIFDS